MLHNLKNSIVHAIKTSRFWCWMYHETFKEKCYHRDIDGNKMEYYWQHPHLFCTICQTERYWKNPSGLTPRISFRFPFGF